MFKLSRILLLGTALAAVPFSVSAQEARDEASNADIVVTSQKIERSVQDTKESIGIVTAEMIQDRNLFDLEDVYNQTANAYDLTNGQNFGIRGITQNSVATSGGQGDLGSIYLDGVAQTGWAPRFGHKGLWDVSSVEILRGPQSTNVGRNALAGAVVVTTNKPKLGQFEAGVRLEYASYNKMAGAAMVNLPLGDIAALRVTAELLNSDGYVTNSNLGLDDFDGKDYLNLRGKLRIEPIENLTIDVIAQLSDNDRGKDFYRADLQPIENRDSLANLETAEDYKALTASLDINYTLNDAISLRAITSILDGDYYRFDDDDGAPTGGNASLERIGYDKNWSQEVRMAYESDRLNGIFGVHYIEVDRDNSTTRITNILPASVGVPASLLPFYPVSFEVYSEARYTQIAKNLAFFTEWDFEVSDGWIISAGLRYDKETQDNSAEIANALAPGVSLPDPVAAGELAETFQAGAGPAVAGGVAYVNSILESQLIPSSFPFYDASYDAWLPQIGITHELSEDAQVSLFYKKGYRVGGAEVNTVGVFGIYEPEFLNNYELSLRTAWMDDALIFNASLYYGDWVEQQVSICVGSGTIDCSTQNAGQSEIYGAEFELSYSPSWRTSLYANLGLASTEFTDFVSGTAGDLTGNEFAVSPSVNLSFGGRQFVTEKVFVSAGFSYVDGGYADGQNSIALDDRTLVDFSIGYRADNFEIKAYANNLTDDFYITQEALTLAGGRIVRVGAPREFGVVLTASF